MREAFLRLRRVDASGKPFECHVITCSRCGHEDRLRIVSTMLPANAVAKKFGQAGWTVARNADRHVCPTCVAKNKPMPKSEPMKTDIKPKVDPKPPQENPVRSHSAQAAIPLLYIALGDAYDTTRKRYKDGQSDERIAKETGLSIEFVRKRREDDFGPLTDTRLEELEKENARLTSELDAVKRRFLSALDEVADAISTLKNIGIT